MLDMKRIRREPEAVRESLARRGEGASALIDEVLALDERRRASLAAFETRRAEQKRAGEAVARAKKGGEDASGAIAEMQQVAADVKRLDAERAQIDAELKARLASLPNLADPDAPPQDTVLREVGDATKRGKDHLELAGERIDMETGARVSGSRFAYLRGDLVLSRRR